MKNIFSLKGRTSVVTGGLGLLGSAVSSALSESGSRVVVIDKNIKDSPNGVRGRLKANGIFVERYDLADINGIVDLIDKIEGRYGAIDIWVNCAYPRTSDWGAKLEAVSIASWKDNIDMQLNSCCICSHEIAGRMAKRRSGSIINIASIYGIVAPDFSIYEGLGMTSPAAYSAIKGGVISYTKYLASYFKGTGVRVNVVCPGGILKDQPKKFIKNYSKKTLLGRMARPQEVAWPVVFLASDAASYMTGTTLLVDGGWTCI